MKLVIRCEDLEDAIEKLNNVKDAPVLIEELASGNEGVIYMDWGTIEDDD